MRIGVICEGVTDFIAIREFMEGALSKMGLKTTYIQLQPTPDNTDDGGWTRVFFWLEDNPVEARVTRFFGGGLFDMGLDNSRCDALIVQMDTDVLEDHGFSGFMNGKNISYDAPDQASVRAEEIRRLLGIFAGSDSMTISDLQKHIFLPAVESSEAWCIAAFERLDFDPETLKGQELWDAFGSALLRSEGNFNLPAQFGSPDKRPERREKFCIRHRSSAFLELQSQQFSKGVEAVFALRVQPIE